MAHQVVEMPFEPADAVQRIKRSAEHDHAQRDAISHAGLGDVR